MNTTFKTLITYLKNPILEKDSEISFAYQLKILGHLLIISLLTGIATTPLFTIIGELGWVNMENHAMEGLMKNRSKTFIFLIAVIAAPIFEELFFRGPLTLFKSKNNFKIAFYVFTILFGFIHITNFEITKNVLLLSPILIIPQLLLGSYLGFIRVRFGLLWSIVLHACYNGTLMSLTFLVHLP